jgi:hypothetical protein
MYSTRVCHVKAARKQHKCSWCAEKIEAGEPYAYYRWYGGDEPATVKMHPECNEGMQQVAYDEGWDIEFIPHMNRRGCSCGGADECEICLKELS